MIISHNLKCIFVHIQKCAGSAVTWAFDSHLSPGDTVLGCTPQGEELERNGGWRGLHKHSRAKKIREVVGERVWNNYFTFTFVRNPWDRAVSTYHWWQTTKYVGNNNKGNIIRDMNSFQEFVMSDYMYHDNCCHYINEPVDYVARFETINSSFGYVCGRLGLPHISLRKRNSSKHDHYSSYYNSESIDRIGTIFSDDIETFGYEFERE